MDASRRGLLTAAGALALTAAAPEAFGAAPAPSAAPPETWVLTELFESPQAWAAEREAVLKQLPLLGGFKGKLGTDAATLRAVAARAAEVGAKVLVDEVYLELVFEDGRTETAFNSDGGVIVTGSLTKAYGLSGLRCGWILAPADLAERMRRLNDLFGVHPPHISERLAMAALARLPALKARADGILEANRARYRDILAAHPALDQIVFDQGTTVFPRLRRGEADAFCAFLRERFETSIAPGRFFGRPDHIRVGLGGDPDMTRSGVDRLAEALSAFI
jgi:aspartate/methionine/tyrosine aminotransferase